MPPWYAKSLSGKNLDGRAKDTRLELDHQIFSPFSAVLKDEVILGNWTTLSVAFVICDCRKKLHRGCKIIWNITSKRELGKVSNVRSTLLSVVRGAEEKTAFIFLYFRVKDISGSLNYNFVHQAPVCSEINTMHFRRIWERRFWEIGPCTLGELLDGLTSTNIRFNLTQLSYDTWFMLCCQKFLTMDV